jgi:hypothetical protein
MRKLIFVFTATVILAGTLASCSTYKHHGCMATKVGNHR